MKRFNVICNIVVYIIIAATVKSGVGQLDPIVQKAIDELVESEIITKSKIPAMSLGIIKNGEVAYTTAYGKRDVENSIPADKSTLFFIGSISKSFTATICVKVLSEKFPELGEAVLDTPIRKLIPSYNFTLGDRYRSERTSFKDLLAHRVGEEVQTLNFAIGGVSNPKEVVYRLRYAKETYPFRNNFLYNNGHFALAADVIAEIARVPYLQLLEELLAQLGMSDTTYCKATDDHDNMPNRAVGYYYNETIRRFNSEYYKTVLPAIGAGGVLSNSVDMMKYGLFHLNLGRVGNTQLIPEIVMKWMHKNNNPFPTTWKTKPDEEEFLDVGYGLGFFISGLDGWQTVHHSGYLPPFTSQFSLFPALRISIFTSASSNGAVREFYLPQIELHKEILNILQGGVRKSEKSSQFLIHDYPLRKSLDTFSPGYLRDSPAIKNAQIPLQAGEILGHYGNGLMGELDITEKLNSSGQVQPYLNYGDWGFGWLHQISSNSFSFQCESDFVQTFYNGGSDEASVEITVTYDSESRILIFNQSGSVNEFEKNQELVNLPEQPWSSDSCGSEYKILI